MNTQSSNDSQYDRAFSRAESLVGHEQANHYVNESCDCTEWTVDKLEKNLSPEELLALRNGSNRSYYDDDVIDDCAHPHVLRARKAGRAWAEREASALTDEQLSCSEWYQTDNDARPLVEFEPSSDVEDQFERVAELAAICNRAAGEHWDGLVESAAARAS